MSDFGHWLWRFENPEEWKRVREEEASKISLCIESLLGKDIEKEEIFKQLITIDGALMLNSPTAFPRGRVDRYAQSFLIEPDQLTMLISNFLNDTDSKIRKGIVSIMGRCGGDFAAHILTEQIPKEEDEGILRFIISSLGNLGGPKSVIALSRIIENHTSDCSNSCLHLLASRVLVRLVNPPAGLDSGYPYDELDAPYAMKESASTATMLEVYEAVKSAGNRRLAVINASQAKQGLKLYNSNREAYGACGLDEVLDEILNCIRRNCPNNLEGIILFLKNGV